MGRVKRTFSLCWLIASLLSTASSSQNANNQSPAPRPGTSIAATPVASSFDWQIATPGSQGMSASRLETLQQAMASKRTRALLIARNDRIVLEWYAPGQSAKTRQGTASLAKALVGGMSLGVAAQDGKIALDDPAAKFVPQWAGDPRKSAITIRQLGSHTSGLEVAGRCGVGRRCRRPVVAGGSQSETHPGAQWRTSGARSWRTPRSPGRRLYEVS